MRKYVSLENSQKGRKKRRAKNAKSERRIFFKIINIISPNQNFHNFGENVSPMKNSQRKKKKKEEQNSNYNHNRNKQLYRVSQKLDTIVEGEGIPDKQKHPTGS